MDIGVDFDIDFYEILTLISNRNTMRFRTEIGLSFVSGFLHVRHVRAAITLVLSILCGPMDFHGLDCYRFLDHSTLHRKPVDITQFQVND